MDNSAANSGANLRAEKNAIRALMTRARATMTPTERELQSRLIQGHLLSALARQFGFDAPKTSGGKATRGERDTRSEREASDAQTTGGRTTLGGQVALGGLGTTDEHGRAGGYGRPDGSSMLTRPNSHVLASYLARADEPDPGVLTLLSSLMSATTAPSLGTQKTPTQRANMSASTNDPRNVPISVLIPNLTCAPVVDGRRTPRWDWLNLSEDRLSAGVHGIPELVNRSASFAGGLPPSALSQADVILVPGLAGGRDGSRLGTGGGWYDEALRFVAVNAEIWLLLFEDELFDTVPTEPHDMRVTRIFTPADEIRIR